MPVDVKGFLLKKKEGAEDEEVAQAWSELEELYSSRLWHQLTLKLLTFVHSPCFRDGGLTELYYNFIFDFENKINLLSLVEVALVVVVEIRDEQEAMTFLRKFRETVKGDGEASLLCLTAIGGAQLRQNKLEDVKTTLEEAEEVLDSLDGVTRVHSRFYDLCSNFHKVNSNYEAFYHDALRFLGCVEVKDIPREEQSERAFCLCLAALMGDNVYNFGELLAHPILDSLRGTKDTWVVKLLQAFNAGNLSDFERLRPFWEQQPDLVKNQDKMMKKIQLLSLMELIFRRHAHDRTITFSDIASAAQIDVGQVELLLMKALSLGLVKGSINQVEQEASMTWVQPRVLDRDQVSTLQNRISEWSRGIHDTVLLMKREVPDAAVQL